MKKMVLLFFIMLALSAFVFAESDFPQLGPTEPDETDIVLPDMYFEIEDLSIEEIDAVIPDNDSVIFMAIDIPLPKPGEIKLPPEVFSLPLSDIPVQNTDVGETSLYCEASIGAGTSTNITGDINLYNIGSRPNFRLRYFHDGYDGFAGHEAGMGFLSREELIEAEIGFSKDVLDIKSLLTFNELEDGLQGQADYYSVTRRIAGFDSTINWDINKSFFIESGLGLKYMGFRLNSDDSTPLSYNFLNFNPDFCIGFNYKKIKTTFSVNYYLGTEISQYQNQTLSTNLSFAADITNYFKIDSKVGLMWDNFNKLYFPFYLNFSGAGSLIYYNIGGGRRLSYSDWQKLWEISPTVAGPVSSEKFGDVFLFDEWYSEGEIKINLTKDFTISSKAYFSYAANKPKADDFSELKGFSSVTTEDSLCLTAGAGFYWGITKIFALDFYWNSQVLKNMDWFLPRHSFKLLLNVDAEDDKMGISMESSFDIYDENQLSFDKSLVPKIGFKGYLTIYDGFILSFNLSDIFANTIDTGRKLWGSYLDKGTVFQALVKISL